MDVLCEIRAEFIALPKPVLKRIVFHRKSSRTRIVEFGTRSTDILPAYYEFRLNDTARQWAKGHTVAEIVAALASLVPDPEVGGEAAVMLTSLATTRTFYFDDWHPSDVSERLSRSMYDIRYRSPSKPGTWDLQTALSFKLHHLVPTALSYDRFAEPGITTPKVSENTLNYYLEEMQSELSYYENGLHDLRRIYGHDPFTNVGTLDDWIVVNLVPPKPEPTLHRKLLDTYGITFLVVASAGWELPRGIAVYELGLEKYWPIVYEYSRTIDEFSKKSGQRGSRLYAEYRTEYDHAVKRRVYEMAKAACGPPTDD